MPRDAEKAIVGSCAQRARNSGPVRPFKYGERTKVLSPTSISASHSACSGVQPARRAANLITHLSMESKALLMSQVENSMESEFSCTCSTRLWSCRRASTHPRWWRKPCWLSCRICSCSRMTRKRKLKIPVHTFRSTSRSIIGRTLLRSVSIWTSPFPMGTKRRSFHQSGVCRSFQSTTRL